MKSGFLFNSIQELFSRGYGLIARSDPYPLRALIRREYEKIQPVKILDVGCGSGSYALPGYDYLGIDPNPRYIEYCRRHRPGQFEQMSAEHLDLPDRAFDVVLCLSVGHHLSDDSFRRMCREIERVLTDNGIFIFADPVRPIMQLRPVAALLEWLDEGRWFRKEQDYLDLLGDEFVIEQTQKITNQFYQKLVVWCRKKKSHAIT